jgi:hypothetical protein
LSGQCVHIIKVIKAVKVVPCVTIRITILKKIKYQRFYKKFVFKKMLVDNVHVELKVPMCGRSCEPTLFLASDDVEVISPRVALY